MFPGELFQVAHQAIYQLGVGLAVEKNTLVWDRCSLLITWRVHFTLSERARKENEDTHMQVAQALAEAMGILDRTAHKAYEAPKLTQVDLDVANTSATDVRRREGALLSYKASLRRRERDLDTREKALAGLEVDGRTREAGAEKTVFDLSAERARLELLREVMDAQKTELKQCKTNIMSREATHQANVDTADAAPRRKHDEQEASN